MFPFERISFFQALDCLESVKQSSESKDNNQECEKEMQSQIKDTGQQGQKEKGDTKQNGYGIFTYKKERRDGGQVRQKQQKQTVGNQIELKKQNEIKSWKINQNNKSSQNLFKDTSQPIENSFTNKKNNDKKQILKSKLSDTQMEMIDVLQKIQFQDSHDNNPFQNTQLTVQKKQKRYDQASYIIGKKDKVSVMYEGNNYDDQDQEHYENQFEQVLEEDKEINRSQRTYGTRSQPISQADHSNKHLIRNREQQNKVNLNQNQIHHDHQNYVKIGFVPHYDAQLKSKDNQKQQKKHKIKDQKKTKNFQEPQNKQNTIKKGIFWQYDLQNPDTSKDKTNITNQKQKYVYQQKNQNSQDYNHQHYQMHQEQVISPYFRFSNSQIQYQNQKQQQRAKENYCNEEPKDAKINFQEQLHNKHLPQEQIQKQFKNSEQQINRIKQKVPQQIRDVSQQKENGSNLSSIHGQNFDVQKQLYKMGYDIDYIQKSFLSDNRSEKNDLPARKFQKKNVSSKQLKQNEEKDKISSQNNNGCKNSSKNVANQKIIITMSQPLALQRQNNPSLQKQNSQEQIINQDNFQLNINSNKQITNNQNILTQNDIKKNQLVNTNKINQIRKPFSISPEIQFTIRTIGKQFAANEQKQNIENYCNNIIEQKKDVEIIKQIEKRNQNDNKTQKQIEKNIKQLQQVYQKKLNQETEHFQSLIKQMKSEINELQYQKVKLNEQVYELQKELSDFRSIQIPKKQELKQLQLSNQRLQGQIYELEQKVNHSEEQIQIFQVKYGHLIEEIEKSLKEKQPVIVNKEIKQIPSKKYQNQFKHYSTQELPSHKLSQNKLPQTVSQHQAYQTYPNYPKLHQSRIQFVNIQYPSYPSGKQSLSSVKQQRKLLQNILLQLKQQVLQRDSKINRLEIEKNQLYVNLRRQKQRIKQLQISAEHGQQEYSLKEKAMENQIKILRYQLNEMIERKRSNYRYVVLQGKTNTERNDEKLYQLANEQSQVHVKQIIINKNLEMGLDKKIVKFRQNSYLNPQQENGLTKAFKKKHDQAIMLSPKVQRIKQKYQKQQNKSKSNQKINSNYQIFTNSKQKGNHLLYQIKNDFTKFNNFKKPPNIITIQRNILNPISPPSTFSHILFTKNATMDQVQQKLQKLRAEVRNQLVKDRIRL